MSHPNTVNAFAEEVKAIPGGEYLEMCFSCGTCVSKCMVQQKVEPDFNPRRLLKLVMMEMREEAYGSPTTWLCSSCDLCYPACPQKIHISGVITAVKQIAVEQANATIIKTAVVDQQTCVACGLCVEACPYDAIALVKTRVPYRGEIMLAKVDPGLCMACGVCNAVCRSTSIGIPDSFSDENILDELWGWLQRQEVVAK
ncbi:MAG: 4Fe-4S dicluster domain-containing protein [Chloroflexi bacterium]|nr:4Fe-4S dicluster domain-containing protein [Chloroflexota bacterium]